jgi:hypothetical protein
MVGCKIVASQYRHEHGNRGIATVRRHYQAMTGKDTEDFMCAAVQ